MGGGALGTVVPGDAAGTAGDGGSAGASTDAGGSNPGGNAGTGGATSVGGSAIVGGNAGTGGAEDTGGLGGTAGGGAGSSYCYAELRADLTSAEQARDFQLDFDAGTFDFSNTTITLRMRAEYAGNTGGIQVFLHTANGGFSYTGWTSFTDLTSWVTLTLTPAQIAAGSGGTFTPTEVERFGVQVSAGSPSPGATWSDITLIVDSITFSDLPQLDMHFNDGAMPLVVGPGDAVSPSATPRVCEDG